jgi:PPOX class probable F420-dependent enzyme
MSSVLPDPTTPFGERVARRLRDETLIWLTTMGADGTPQPNPVWFLWDGATFLIYNQTHAKRLEHIQRNPRVSLNFDSDGEGEDIVVITGEARPAPEEPPIDHMPAYVEKYASLVAQMQLTPASFASDYSVAIRVTPTKVRGF